VQSVNESSPSVFVFSCSGKVDIQALATDLGAGDPALEEHFCDEQWRYRKGTSDARGLRTVLEERLFSAVRLSFPAHRAQAAVLRVIAIAIFLKYPRHILRQFLTKHSKRFPCAYSQIIDAVMTAIGVGGPLGSSALFEFAQSLE
jgi:hypothetical protein